MDRDNRKSAQTKVKNFPFVNFTDLCRLYHKYQQIANHHFIQTAQIITAMQTDYYRALHKIHFCAKVAHEFPVR